MPVYTITTECRLAFRYKPLFIIRHNEGACQFCSYCEWIRVAAAATAAYSGLSLLYSVSSPQGTHTVYALAGITLLSFVIISLEERGGKHARLVSSAALPALISFVPPPSGPASENRLYHRGPARRPVGAGRAGRRGGAAAGAAASGGHAGDGEEGRREAGGEAGEGQGRAEEHAGQGQQFKKKEEKRNNF